MLIFLNAQSDIFASEICGDIISTSFHTFVYCFTFEENHDFQMILLHRKLFLQACYLHFKLEYVLLPGRNPYKFSHVESEASSGNTKRLQGAWGKR